MTKNGIRSSKKLASDASKALRQPQTSKLAKSLAGAAMGNRPATTSKLSKLKSSNVKKNRAKK